MSSSETTDLGTSEVEGEQGDPNLQTENNEGSEGDEVVDSLIRSDLSYQN